MSRSDEAASGAGEAPRRRHLWLAVGILVTLASVAPQAGASVVTLDRADLAAGVLALDAPWRYHPGDRPEYAAIDFDDSSWHLLDTTLRSGTGRPLPPAWPGIGWFRLQLDVAPNLAGIPLGLDLRHVGALELFLDGRRLATYGRLAETPDGFVPRTQPSALHLTLTAGRHLLAVRYANPLAERFHRVGWRAGFSAVVGPSEAVAARELSGARLRRGQTGVFCAIFLSFAVLHFLLFVFYPTIRENLYFALLCVAAAALAFLLFYKREIADPRFMLFSEPAMNVCGVLFGLIALRFVYGIFHPRLPRFWPALVILAAALCGWTLWQPARTLDLVFLFMLASCLELIRVVVGALRRREKGSVIVGAGALAMAGGFTLGLLSNLGVLAGGTLFASIIPFSSIIALLLSMSIYLSLTFARTQRELRRQLEEVERLSEQRLEQERAAAHERLERELLTAQYERKAAELEEARELQLSMLPRRLPKVPGLSLAADMRTATEVGGDYYDFLLDDDGVLHLAVGDATGHGLRAGTMVTAAKTLFQALVENGDLVPTLALSGRVLKRLQLRRLAMALALGRYRGHVLELAMAAMPPALLYRAASGQVESIDLPGMPLATLAGFPYEQRSVELAPGDTLLLMSDGFPERLDPQDEMLGYERTTELFAGLGGRAPADIIAELNSAGEDWAAGRPLDDDVTLVVLQRTGEAEDGRRGSR